MLQPVYILEKASSTQLDRCCSFSCMAIWLKIYGPSGHTPPVDTVRKTVTLFSKVCGLRGDSQRCHEERTVVKGPRPSFRVKYVSFKKRGVTFAKRCINMWRTGGENGFKLYHLPFISAPVLSSSPPFVNPYQMFSKVRGEVEGSKTQHHTRRALKLRTGSICGDTKYVRAWRRD